MPARLTSRHRFLRRAIRSRTSRNPRRSRRTASGRPADKCSGMTTRLRVVASADHWHMPFHQERIIGRRHHTHAADRHLCGQPLPLCRSQTCRHAIFETFCQIVITVRAQGGDHLLLGGICLRHLSVCGHALFMWRGLLSRDLSGKSRLVELAMAAPQLPRILLRGLLSRGVCHADPAQGELLDK